MYSKEEKEMILSEFHASGMSAHRFAAKNGYPSHASIMKWIKQEEAGLLDVPIRTIRGRADDKGKHKRYSEKTKREAVKLYAKGMPSCDVARRLHLSSGVVVTTWARKAGIRKGHATISSTKGVRPMDEEAKAEIERLSEEVEALTMDLRVMLELMRDPKAGNPEKLSNKQKTALGEKLRRDFGYSQKQVVTYFDMPRSTYNYDSMALSRDTARRKLVEKNVRRAFEESGRIYGYRRVRAAMTAWNEPFYASEREVRRTMREGHMCARRTRKRSKWSSYQGEVDERPANIPLRDDGSHGFSTDAPGEMIVTDVTEFAIGKKKVYLSPIVDCFDGLPVAWSISTHPDSELCDSSLKKYLAVQPSRKKPVCHTDGGACYRSATWKRICTEFGIIRSMSRKGRSPDNARAEGFFGTLKEEFYNGRTWDNVSIEEFEEQLNGYIEWYREGRLKAFREDGKVVYSTIMGRRRRLGYAA